MEITEKVAYLKGLVEGMGLDTTKKEGKLFATILDVLEDMALELADLQEAQEELGEGLDAVSDDLEDVEDVVFGDDEDDEDDYEDEEGEDCYATTCPSCGDTLYFDEDILADGELICPNCGEKLSFDLDGEEVPGAPAVESYECVCPNCGAIYQQNPDGSQGVCPSCGWGVAEQSMPDDEEADDEDSDDGELPF